MRKQNFWPPANEVPEGNVFTGVCLSTRGVECLPLGPVECLPLGMVGGVCLWVQGSRHPLGRHPLLGIHPPPGQTPAPGQTPPPRDDHWSERCASYWNAFLSFIFFRLSQEILCKRCSFHNRLVWTTCYNHYPFPNLQWERVLSMINSEPRVGGGWGECFYRPLPLSLLKKEAIFNIKLYTCQFRFQEEDWFAYVILNLLWTVKNNVEPFYIKCWKGTIVSYIWS